MTALVTRAAPGAEGTLEERWATPVWLGTVRPSLDHERLRDEMRRTQHGCRDLEADDVLDADRARAAFAALAQPLFTPDRPETVQLSVQIWAADHRVPLAYGSGLWSAWCYLAVAGEDATGRSGAVCLHDPRAGCDAAAVPGLPWGRALTLQSEPGLAVLAPGWLAHSILPVSSGHTVAVLVARQLGGRS
ncbi:hypothetical protein ABR737_02495 [Streptomyces sp. Edi2]|uniref:hypothetical protein n=1 Tax=Streptomyces sp. Edi2 TaxID=3162528 RepID=UPI003305C1BD